jgi:hypothetical protein
MNAVYHTTLRHAKGLAVVLLFASGLAVIVPVVAGAYYFAAFSFVFAAFIVWRFQQMSLYFTDDGLTYRGWFSRHEIPYSAIERVFRPADAGWPRDRLYAHSVFEIVSRVGRARLNVLWFGPAGSRAFQERILHHDRHVA